MKIVKFILENYRAIEKAEIDISFSINPIIGVNESGKTTVLKGILAFDHNRDNFNNGEHLDFQNKYSTTDTKSSTITAVIKLEKSEIVDLIDAVNLKDDSSDYKYLKTLKPTDNILLSRNFTKDNKSYNFNNDEISSTTKTKIEKFLVKHLPFILYFDDFSDRVPEEITFPDDYKNTGKLNRSKQRDWQEIIVEIFKRANPEGIEDNTSPLQNYMNISNSDRKSDILSDIEDELNKEIIKEWKRIKQQGKSLADDSEKLDLVIVNEDNKFEFKVRDKSYNDKKRTFNISERSKGFQWFFNYMIKLKFNHNYKQKIENSIFLLDEPGSYLHSSAQSELLHELQRVSKKNTIIYCTHSQYLLNPDVIKLGSIKIANKKDSKISFTEYGAYKATKDKSALTPIYQALHLNFSHDFLGRILITEGITDYYFIKMLQNNSSFVDKAIKIIPSAGASQSSTLISFALSFADSFCILLDNDKAGKDAFKKYKKEFGQSFTNNCHIYCEDKDKFMLEDYLSQNDQNRLMSITNCNDIKRAWGFIFYDYSDKQEEFILKLDKKTLNNVKSLIERISNL